MFHGNFPQTVDEKGRTNIPAKFRVPLLVPEARLLMITPKLTLNADIPCLEVWPIHSWNQFTEKLSRLPQFEQSVIAIKKLVVAHAQDCPVDKNWRILIPPSLREQAKIMKEIVWVGSLDRIEIWNKEAWDVELHSTQKDLNQAIFQKLSDLGL